LDKRQLKSGQNGTGRALFRAQERHRKNNLNRNIYCRLLKQCQLPVLRFNINFNGRLLVEKTVCSNSGNQVHNEVVNGAMARMFNVADIFQFIVNCFNYRAFSQQDTVYQWRQPVFHIVSDTGYKMNAIVEKRFKQGLGDVALVAEEFSEEFLCERFNGFGVPVIHIAGCQAKREQFALVIANKMEFKAIKPAHCTFSTFGQFHKNLVAIDAFVVANGNFGTVDKGYTCAFTKTNSVQKEHHGHEYAVFKLNKAVV
jgi:hypothetical protein